jgi:transcriptional adapter 2-alpha
MSGKTLQRLNSLKGDLDSSQHGSHKGSPTTVQAITRSLDEWDISGFAGAELLSEPVRILPHVL